MLRSRPLAACTVMLLAVALINGCAPRQQQAQQPPRQRVAGAQEGAATVTATLSDAGLQLDNNQITANNLTLRATNNSNVARTLILTGPDNFNQRLSVPAGQTDTRDFQNLPPGSYQLAVEGMENQSAWRQNLTVNRPQQGTIIPVTITASALQIAHTQIPAGNVTLRVDNQAQQQRVLIVTGPNDLTRRIEVPAGQTQDLPLRDLQQGQYRLAVDGMLDNPNMQQTLTVTERQSAVTATITAQGLRLDQQQVHAADLTVRVVNQTPEARTLVVTGPNNFHQRIPAPANQTDTARLNNIPQGAYQVTVEGMTENQQAFQQNLTVSAPEASEPAQTP